MKENMITMVGYGGAIIAAVMPMIEAINVYLQFIASLGGLILLFFSIIHKLIQIKNDGKKLYKSK